MHEIFIVAGLGFFSLLAWLRRDYAVYLIVLLLPTYQIRFSLAGIPGTFLEGMILILGVLGAWRAWGTGGQRIKLTAAHIWIFLFFLAGLISVFTSPVTLKAAGVFKAYVFEPILFYFLARNIINTPTRLANLWNTLSLLVLYLSLFGIYQFLSLENLPPSWWAVDIASRRITSLLNHPNALALLLGPILGLLVFLPRKNFLCWSALIFGLLPFYLTFSRAGWLALLGTVFILGLWTRYRKIVLTSVMIGLLFIVAIPFSREKLFALASGGDPSQENRYVLWAAAGDMLKQSPFLGVGLMGFRESFKNYPVGPDQVVQNYPHNIFLNFWLETGLLGLISIFAVLVVFLKRLHGELKIPLLAAMMVIFLHGLVDVPYFKNDLSVLFWLFLALPETNPSA